MRFLAPSEFEKNPEFWKRLQSMTKGGMRAAGMLGVGGAAVYVLAHALSDANFVWSYRGTGSIKPVVLWNKALIALFGFVLLASSRMQMDLRVGRSLISLFLFATALALIWEDKDAADFTFTAGWLSLVMFVSVGAFPFRPLQTGAICATIVVLYAVIEALQSGLPGGLASRLNVSRLIFLGIVTLLCVIMSSAIYVSRLEQFVSLQRIQRMQGVLIQKEKWASLGQLTAGIAHEISNPLNFVSNFSGLNRELLCDLRDELGRNPDDCRCDVPSRVEDLLNDLEVNSDKVLEHGKRAALIVGSMIEHAHTRSGDLRFTDLNQLVDQHVDLVIQSTRALHDEFDVQVDRDFDESLGLVAIVPEEIGRVILNVLKNGFYAVHDRKSVDNDHYQPLIRLSTRRVFDNAIITIADNGSGIPKEHREHVFEPFFTTKPAGKGTGLGLSLSHDIVTAGHGGTMSLDSVEGEGTTCMIVLPIRTSDGNN